MAGWPKPVIWLCHRDALTYGVLMRRHADLKSSEYLHYNARSINSVWTLIQGQKEGCISLFCLVPFVSNSKILLQIRLAKAATLTGVTFSSTFVWHQRPSSKIEITKVWWLTVPERRTPDARWARITLPRFILIKRGYAIFWECLRVFLVDIV